MEILQFKDINFKELKKGIHKGTNSVIYIDNDTCYKFFNENIDNFEKIRIKRMFYELDDINNSGILLPKCIIMHGNYFVGYTMKKINGKTVNDIYLREKKYIDCNYFFSIIEKITDILKELHQLGIIVTDFNFDNILLDQNDNIYYADVDSFSYKSNVGQITSVLLTNYLTKYNMKIYRFDQNTDKLSLLLSTLQVLYSIEPSKITNSYYNYYARRIKSLSNMKPLYKKIINTDKNLCNVDYIDEYIYDNEKYIIDRKKQLVIRKNKCGI